MFAVDNYVVCINNLNCEQDLDTHNSDGTPTVHTVYYVYPNGFINVNTPEPTIDDLGDDPSRFRYATEDEIKKYVEESNLLWKKAQELINQRISDLFTASCEIND